MFEQINKYTEAGTPFIFIIDFDKVKPIVIPLDEVNGDEILYDLKGVTNYNYKPSAQSAPKQILFDKCPVSYSEYKGKFDVMQSNLLAGNTYLANLTYPTPIKTSLSLKEIFEYSKAPYKLWVKDKFVVFSPETFVTIKDDIISSFPMKGTINASLPNAEETILNDKKELAEHSTIVDLIRNDLSIVADSVELKKFRYISKIKTHNSELLQVSSEIAGVVKKELRTKLGNLLYQLLPAGSISGAPKKKTVEIIREAEGYDRGYYTGVFGYYDGKNMESAVMIRFIENMGGEFYYKSGGGITLDSDCKAEYDELIDKVYVPIN